MTSDDFKKILARYASGSATAGERELVERYYQKLQDANAGLTPPADPRAEARLRRSVAARTGKHTTVRWVYRLSAVAAVLVGLAFLVPLLSTTERTVITSPRGERREVTLADGSTVLLNAGSTLAFAEDFTTNRHLTLSGEAYFDVARDTLHPFTVVTGRVRTRVLGTSFTIRQATDDDVLVSVTSGRVETSAAGEPARTVVLTAGQRSHYRGAEPPHVTRGADAAPPVWTDGVLQLDRTTLTETARLVGDWYDVNIELHPAVDAERRLSGKFRNERLEDVLTSITILTGLEVETLGPRHLRITPPAGE